MKGDYIGCACLMPLYYTDFCCFYDVVRWWFTIDRREADKLLMLPGNPRGTFLVRKSTGIYQWTQQVWLLDYVWINMYSEPNNL